MKVHWPSLGIGVCSALGVFAFTFFLFGQGIEKSSNPPLENQTTGLKETFDLITENGSPSLGSKNAPIVMIEFGDYQCFYCNQFYHTVEPDIVRNYINTGKVRLIFKDYTIIGQDSVNAAHAAHCAQETGKFWEYHDVLYDNWTGENTGWASLNNLQGFARKIGIDDDQFNQCMTQSRYISVIQGSLSNAKALGLTGTPDFFIIASDDSVTKVVGAQPYVIFDQIFKSKLKS